LFILSKKSNGKNINISLFCQIPMFCRGEYEKDCEITTNALPYLILRTPDMNRRPGEVFVFTSATDIAEPHLDMNTMHSIEIYSV
jgi:hypothetical protein